MTEQSEKYIIKNDDDEALLDFLDVIRGIRRNSSIGKRRDFFRDRIIQSLSRTTLPEFLEHLQASVDMDSEMFAGALVVKMTRLQTDASRAARILDWVRTHTRWLGLLAGLGNERFEEALGAGIPQLPAARGSLSDKAVVHEADVPAYDIPLACTLLSPLTHGSDEKAGNATLFRRRRVITRSQEILHLPFYAGNAIRGQMRDLMAVHFFRTIGMHKSKWEIFPWFFATFFSGGVLAEDTKETAGIRKLLNPMDGQKEFRELMPGLSLLGGAMGNTILAGRFAMGDLRPRCKEWGFVGSSDVHTLLDWEYLTRRDDRENREEDEKHQGMIASTECLMTGTLLQGGVDLYPAINELELSALGRGLRLLHDYGYLGGQNRRGFGKVAFVDFECPSPVEYDRYLVQNAEKLTEWLLEIGAVRQREEGEQLTPEVGHSPAAPKQPLTDDWLDLLPFLHQEKGLHEKRTTA